MRAYYRYDQKNRSMNQKSVRRHLGVAVATLGAVLLSAAPSQAQDAASVISLREAFERAAAQLPEAAASPALKAQADAQRRAASGPFVGPPVARGDVLTRSGGTIEQEASVSAAIKWPGEARAGVNAATLSGDAANAGLAAAQLALAGDIRTVYWRLAGARRAVDIEQQHVATARTETDQVERLVQAGVQARRDLLVSQAELGVALARLSAAETDLAETTAAVEALIGTAPTSFADEALSSGTDIESHPALLAAEAKAKAADAKAGYARYSLRPRVEGSIGVRRQRNDPRGSYEDALLVGIAVPLGRDSRAVADAAGTRAEALSASAEAARLRARLIADQRAALERLSVAERALSDAEARQAALREALMLTQRGRVEGEIGYIEYLRARQALFDAERALGAAQVAKSAAISDVNQTMGVLP
ncbi:TolC family protein [Erythrobacter donghaensis]|uniref:TolC family protein n=1 Tax=Erythrobacter donghaensis TaxID=267135 RepID=UPI0012D96C73|nr:TolC family protein [Erythrobacter donghaensis]